VLDIDLGHGLVFFLLVFIALPVVLAAVATVAIVRLVRNATRRLAVGVYLMLVCALVAPAPIWWADDHLGFTSSQAVEGYGALFWIVGAIAALDSLTWVVTRRQALALALGVFTTVALCGWVLAGIGAAVGLALIPALGTLEVLLALGWLARRLAPVPVAIDWRWATGAGATCACAMTAYVYLRGPHAFGSQARGMDLALLAVLAWLPVVVLARLPTGRMT